MLTLYLNASLKHAEKITNCRLYDNAVPDDDPDGVVIEDDIKLALMLLVSHWYENREPVSMTALTDSVRLYQFWNSTANSGRRGIMQAGRLRHRVTIQNFTTSRTPSGQPVEKWEDGKTIWAEVKGISGRELLAAGAERADATIRVWVRFRTDISASSRLKVRTGPFKGAVLNVTGPPVPDIKGTRLEILCKQGTEK
jgi:SPP1 family predicted phage head-tail adaptor